MCCSGVAGIFGIETSGSENFRFALTHSSFTKENNLPATECYERLEFLGDAVLKLTISDILYRLYPDADEGELSKIRSIVVSDNTLSKIAKSNGLQNLIILAKHEEKLRNIESVCACTFEAVLGAYYLDGKFAALENYIEKTFMPYIEDVKDNFVNYNAKAILQEYTQGADKTTPKYEVVSESGPSHKKVFEVQVSYQNIVLATEKGFSKKDAEQKCAYSACKKLGII